MVIPRPILHSLRDESGTLRCQSCRRTDVYLQQWGGWVLGGAQPGALFGPFLCAECAPSEAMPISAIGGHP